MSYVTNELVSTLQDVKTFQYFFVFQILHVYCTNECQKVFGYSNKIHVLLMTPKYFIDVSMSSTSLLLHWWSIYMSLIDVSLFQSIKNTVATEITISKINWTKWWKFSLIGWYPRGISLSWVDPYLCVYGWYPRGISLSWVDPSWYVLEAS